MGQGVAGGPIGPPRWAFIGGGEGRGKHPLFWVRPPGSFPACAQYFFGGVGGLGGFVGGGFGGGGGGAGAVLVLVVTIGVYLCCLPGQHHAAPLATPCMAPNCGKSKATAKINC